MDTTEGLRRYFPDWQQHASRLVDGVRDLGPEQLVLRAGPDHAPVWALAAHVAGTRVYWLCGILGEPGADRATFVDLASGSSWEDDETHPRSADELVDALEVSWSVIARCLDRWSPSMLDEPFERRYGDAVRLHTRASVLNRVFTHDAFHAGEISQLLGVAGLPAIDLWRSAATTA